jgi:tetratricopeptide (TPR) repeat protein
MVAFIARPHPLHRIICPVVIWALCCSLLCPPLSASAGTLTLDADSQFGFAQHLFTEGHFEHAADEFDRFIYFFPNDDRVTAALFQKGMSFYRANRFQEAQSIFSQLEKQERQSEYRSRGTLMIAACQSQLNDVQGAVASLQRLIENTREATVKDEAWYQLAWLMIETANWQKAKIAFQQLSPTGSDKYQSGKLLSALDTTDTIPQKNPNIAGFFSIIPGAGHLYCERPRDATIAFFLNIALTTAAWQAFDQEMPWLGGLLSFVEIGVYSGTVYSAVSSAHKYNRQKTIDFIEQLKRQATPFISLGPVPGGFQLSLNVDF